MRTESSLLDTYFGQLTESAPLLFKARAAAEQLGLGGISLSDVELSILATLVRLHSCRKFVEIGTLTGASGLAILQGMDKDSTLWTFEKENKHADFARPILEESANSKHQSVHIVLGDAQLKLSEIESEGPFDGIFIDGNKAAYGDYLDWTEKNIRQGGLIIADNVFLGGSIFNGTSEKFSAKQIQVVKAFNQRLFNPKLYQSCLLPTLEGLSVSIKLFA